MAAGGLDDDASDDNFTEDESSPLTNDNSGGSQPKVEKQKGWDVFINPPIKRESGSMANQEFFETTIKITKLLAYLLTFVIVLGSGVISKGTLLFMTSQLNKQQVLPYCNKELGREKQFIVKIDQTERVAWMWCIIFAFWLPELGAWLRAMRICFFKSWEKPIFSHGLLLFVTETCHAIGLALLVFSVLPDLDVVKGAMLTNCLCFVPGLLGLLSRSSKETKGWSFIRVIVDLVAIAAQATGFVAWPLVESQTKELWVTPVAIFLISIGWWENYASPESPLPFIKTLGEIRKNLDDTRYFLYTFIPIWKMICFFCASLIIVFIREGEISFMFSQFSESFGKHAVTVQEIQPVLGGTSLPDVSELIRTGNDATMTSSNLTALYVLLINISCSYICYIFGKFACKILIQGFSYAFPVNLTVPMTVSLLITFCGLRNGDPCYFHDVIPPHLFFTSPPVYLFEDFISHQQAWVWLLWLLSQTWITIHVWTPKIKRIAKTEEIFVSPMYDALLIDQSLALNRRRDDPKNDDSEEKSEEHEEASIDRPDPKSKVRNSDEITRIYACGTMWHETKEEMIEFLKSILRLDEDQCARRIAQKFFNKVDPDYYEFETHIFFDDAFEISDHSEDDNQVNGFVKLLVETIDEAASEVHQAHIHVKPPKKYPTPYGGRLVWTLPGKTKMIAHLKDNSKIRHRKRWSQVMYMYYLLGHKLMDLQISTDSKAVRAENTYLLALDGDIDFQPRAVSLLIDLMKKNKDLGAACGRIHPIGSGPMVWYQMFEYAIGHWLQKATEHIIGCVLCSPGCFSLFRGKALMDINVMNKYTTRSEKALHYVQYDQGEDRWLCTLLLQRGYRVEYSAASDAYTHCPEGFNEFYNQRRRWIPSTVANILDLLMDSKRTIENNKNISMPYIAYHILMMGGTILGPGTIFLMLVGAFVAAFQIDNWTSFFYNIIPILLFMFVCFTCKSNIQLFVAGVISTVYGLVMMAVLVGIMLQIKNDGWLAPSTIFLFLIAGELIVTALFHPQELRCLPCGLVYYITVPSMYLLLIIYSVFNLNNITWGTREVATRKTKEELEKERKEAEEAKKNAKQKSFLGFLQGGGTNNEEGSLEFSLAGLFKCMLCTHKKDGDEKIQLMHIAESLDKLSKKLEMTERIVDPQGAVGRRHSMSARDLHQHPLQDLHEESEDDESSDATSETMSMAPREKRNDLVNPYWIEDKALRKGEVDYLSSAETQFWKDLLDKYLYPLNENKMEKEKIAKDLKDLRDLSVFAFFMMNAIFVLIVFLLTLKKDYLHINWPLGIKSNITYDDILQEVHITNEYLQLEPIGLVFVFFFAVILVIQFTAMLLHRFSTLSHILASTDLSFNCLKKKEDVSGNKLLDKHAVDIAKKYQRLRPDDDYENDSGAGPDRIDRRKTIHHLVEHAAKKIQIGTLEDAFEKRFFEPENSGPGIRNQESSALQKELEGRRKTILAERRISKMKTTGETKNFAQINGLQLRNRRNFPPAPVSDDAGHVNNAYVADELAERNPLQM